MKNLVAALSALLLALASMPAFAQASGDDAAGEQPGDAGPSIQFNLLSIEGLTIGTTITIDAEFGEQYGIEVETPFSFMIPTREDGLALLGRYPDSGDVSLIKLTYATDEENRQFVENLQFVPMTIPEGELGERMQAMADLLVNNAYEQSIAPFPENNFIGWREAKIAGYDAVEVLGEYADPTWGLMFLRIVGFLNPDGPGGVLAVANISARMTPIESTDDFPRTRTGVAIEQFSYLD